METWTVIVPPLGRNLMALHLTQPGALVGHRRWRAVTRGALMASTWWLLGDGDVQENQGRGLSNSWWL